MMNRTRLFVALTTVVFCVSAEQQNSITLNPIIIGLIDGQPFGLHGELVGAIYKIARDIQALQLGRRTQAGRVGLFTYDGQAHTIRTLAALESRITNTLEHLASKTG